MRVFELKNTVIITHKTFSLIVILVLSLALLAVGAFAPICHKGEYLPNYTGDFQDNPQEKIIFVPYPHPSETQGHFCNLQKYRASDIRKSFLTIFNEKKYFLDGIQVVENDTFSAHHIQNECERQLYAEIIVHPTPIYIQHQALLC